MKNLSDVVVVENANGENVTLTAPDDTVNVHLRPGYIVPVQNNTVNGFNVNITSQLSNNPISLIVNRDKNNHSEGRLMINNDNKISSISN
jgi:alpha-glucosidase (family GH31 glycosyl hydrolase)